MKFASVRELSLNPSRWIDLKEPIIITRRGKPVRAMVSMDEEELEDFILAQHFGLEKESQKALQNRQKGKNIPSPNLRALFKKQTKK